MPQWLLRGFLPSFKWKFSFFSPFTVSPCNLSLGFDDEPTFFLTHIVFHGPNVASSHTSQTSNDNQSCLKAVLIWSIAPSVSDTIIWSQSINRLALKTGHWLTSTSQKRIQFMFQNLVVLVRQMTPWNSKYKEVFVRAVGGKPKHKEWIHLQELWCYFTADIIIINILKG